MTMTDAIFYFLLVSGLHSFGSICDGKVTSISLFKIVDTVSVCNEVENSVTIKGEHIKVSEFTMDNGELKAFCKNPIKSISVIATARLTLDRNINAPGVRVFVLAPTWKIIDSRNIRVNLKGQKHAKPLLPNPQKKTTSTSNGVHGKPGRAGNPGGNFVGIGDEFINGEALSIDVSGGDGQDGGDGGDGGDGEHGLYADKDYLDLDCLNPECHDQDPPRREKNTISNEGNFHVFHCKLVEFKGKLGFPTCTFVLKGENGRPSGNGGNSGQGGDSGKPGNILLTELEGKAGIETIQNSGMYGRDGEVGKAGFPGSNGHNVTFRFKSYLGMTSSTPRKKYIPNPMKNGVDGIVSARTEKATSQLKIDLSEVANHVVAYKEYALENLNLSDVSDSRVQFYYKIGKNQAIMSMFDTVALVNELRALEKQFHKLYAKVDFLPLYQSLLNRTAEYAKQPNSQSRRTAEHKKVLTYLYTTILSRDYNLKDRSETNLIVEIGSYLDLVLDSIRKYKDSNKIHTIDQYKENYETNIKLKTQEAHEFIDKDIIPALESALDENKKNVDLALEKIIELEEKSKDKIQEIGAKKLEFQSKMIAALVCDFMSLSAKFVALIPKFGAAASVALEVTAGSLVEGLGLNEQVQIPPQQIVEGALGAESEITKLRNTATMELREVIDYCIKQLNKYPDEVPEELEKIYDIKKRLNEALGMADIAQLREELYKVLRGAEVRISKPSDKTTPTAVTTNIRPRPATANLLGAVVKVLPVLTLTGPLFLGIAKKWSDREDHLRKLDNFITQERETLEKLRKHENAVRNEMGTALEMMSSNVANVANSLGGKSQVALDVTKWKIQTYLQNTHSSVKAMVKGLNVSEQFTDTFRKIEDAVNVLIGVYDRIQSFQEDKNRASYIADIYSAGSKSITISDPKLQNAINYLDVIINCNIVIQQYQTALDAFKQYVFPFAHLIFKELVLPEGLNYGEDLDGLVIKAETQINHIKKKYDEYRFVAKRYDSYLGTGNFNSKYRSTKPFFVWNSKTHSKMISNLFSGKKVIVFADVSQSNPRFDAIKFNEVEINFKAKDSKTQSAITKVLRDFEISAIHRGNSYFRTNDQYFLITTGRLEFWYSFEKDRNGNPVKQTQLVHKIKNGAFMLSPYATWELQLIHSSERNRKAFEVIYKYKEQVDIELIGHGHFLYKDKLDIDIKIDAYYTPLK